jgi:hypothetical protein
VSAELQEQLQNALGKMYILDRELGGGGMSRVFVAHETALGRRVVVKVLLPELAAGVNIERFRREIQLAAQLQHPHIVPLLSAGEAEGLPYFIMPFVTGESLRARVTRQGELPIGETVRILRDVVSALAYALAAPEDEELGELVPQVLSLDRTGQQGHESGHQETAHGKLRIEMMTKLVALSATFSTISV